MNECFGHKQPSSHVTQEFSSRHGCCLWQSDWQGWVFMWLSIVSFSSGSSGGSLWLRTNLKPQDQPFSSPLSNKLQRGMSLLCFVFTAPQSHGLDSGRAGRHCLVVAREYLFYYLARMCQQSSWQICNPQLLRLRVSHPETALRHFPPRLFGNEPLQQTLNELGHKLRTECDLLRLKEGNFVYLFLLGLFSFSLSRPQCWLVEYRRLFSHMPSFQVEKHGGSVLKTGDDQQSFSDWSFRALRLLKQIFSSATKTD